MNHHREGGRKGRLKQVAEEQERHWWDTWLELGAGLEPDPLVYFWLCHKFHTVRRIMLRVQHHRPRMTADGWYFGFLLDQPLCRLLTIEDMVGRVYAAPGDNST